MKRISIIFSIALIGMLATISCSSAPAATAIPATDVAAATEAPTGTLLATETPAQPPAPKGLFKITKADSTSFDVTLDAVKALPLASLTVEGKVQEGPKLKEVLALASVTEFIEITINGSGAPTTLKFEQVDDNTILDFSNRGTMKLATTYIPKANWTKDITEIVVK